MLTAMAMKAVKANPKIAMTNMMTAKSRSQAAVTKLTAKIANQLRNRISQLTRTVKSKTAASKTASQRKAKAKRANQVRKRTSQLTRASKIARLVTASRRVTASLM